jgi:hypothetical protein
MERALGSRGENLLVEVLWKANNADDLSDDEK